MNKKTILLVIIGIIVIAGLVVVFGKEKSITPEALPESGIEETNTMPEIPGIPVTHEEYGSIFSLSTDQGVAPLLIELTPQFKDGEDNWIDFGDGTTEDVTCVDFVEGTEQCTGINLISHTFTTPGSYTVSFMSGVKSNPAEAVTIASGVVEVEEVE